MTVKKRYTRMIPIVGHLKTFFENRAILKEWKRTVQLKNDYEALSELARYVNEQLESLGNSEVHRFFGMGRKSVRRDPVFSGLETYLNESFPTTFGECLDQISDEDFEVFQGFLASRMDNRIDLENLHYVVFSGGGAKGMAYPGVLKALDEIDIHNNGESILDGVKETAGASAGALISVPLALGYTAKEIEGIVLNNRYEHFFDESVVSSHGLRAELTRAIKKFSSKLRRGLAEIEYIDVFTREMNKCMLDHTAKVIAADKAALVGKEPTKEEINDARDYVRTCFLTMTHHEMMLHCDYLESENLLDKWMASASEKASVKVKSRFMNFITRKFPDFGGFNSGYEAMRFSMRRYYGSDKIEEFIGDLIEDSLDRVPENELERVVPSMTKEADKVLARNIAIVMQALAANAAPKLAEAGYAINQVDGWREMLDEMLRQNEYYHGVWAEHEGYHWPQLFRDVQKHGVDHQELNTALAATRELSDHAFVQLMNACDKDNLNYDKMKDQIQGRIPKWAFKSQRRLYKRNLNFHELNKLAKEFPEYGFRKLHITMCRLDGKFNLGELLKDREGFLNRRYKLAMGSHKSLEYSRMPIKTSARISMNLPVGFEKKVYYGEKFIDGGTVNNTPSDVFLNDEVKGYSKTLTCLLGENSFFEKGRHIKEAIKGTRMSAVDRIRSITNPLIPMKKFIGWACYKLNPNYEKITTDDLWRSIIVRTDDVSTGDFGIDNNKKQALIDQAREDTKKYLENGDDVQLAFLNSRKEHLERVLQDRGLGRKLTIKPSEPLRDGIFSTGDMAELHQSMASNSSMRKYMAPKKRRWATGNLGL